VRHFGPTSVGPKCPMDTSDLGPKCLRSEVSQVRSVR